MLPQSSIQAPFQAHMPMTIVNAPQVQRATIFMLLVTPGRNRAHRTQPTLRAISLQVARCPSPPYRQPWWAESEDGWSAVEVLRKEVTTPAVRIAGSEQGKRGSDEVWRQRRSKDGAEQGALSVFVYCRDQALSVSVRRALSVSVYRRDSRIE
ncbi:hypothetical protein NDU88_005138 [Pleurodeles waltl]|uniref:Uncharacterized protein n=1 Tax=Pleurodeles waltl TaxID=8319 RepID=A0AAV7VL37_PLEWA|nr:hypothetical protein NDU88_005138 [Pleurodeles waltl]